MIFHLVQQVYCSPGLKKLFHKPVMTLLARTNERRESILHVWLCALVPVHSEWWIQIHKVYVHVSVITQVHYNTFMIDCNYMRQLQNNSQMTVHINSVSVKTTVSQMLLHMYLKLYWSFDSTVAFSVQISQGSQIPGIHTSQEGGCLQGSWFHRMHEVPWISVSIFNVLILLPVLFSPCPEGQGWLQLPEVARPLCSAH